MADEQKTVRVEVITTDTSTMSHLPQPSGWGSDAEKVVVEGKVVEILVRRGKAESNGTNAEFGIRILEDGSIIITSYNSMLATSLVERNLRFTNERPWKS